MSFSRLVVGCATTAMLVFGMEGARMPWHQEGHEQAKKN